VLVLLFEFFSGVVLGDHDFLFFNLLLLAQPAVVTLAYIVLWSVGWLSVESALAVWAVSLALVLAVAAPRVLRRHGLGRADMTLGKSTVSYGARAHGTRIGGLANQRLDLFIIPAFVAASQVGLYSVASNVSFIIVTLAGALYPLVLPAAARLGDRGPEAVILSLHVTLLVALVLAVAVGILADIAVALVYGSAFTDSVLSLRLLLPGSVLYAGARVLASGLYAANRPFTATVAETAGVVITLAGLILFLDSGGIVAAAVVTTVSYTIVFFAALLLYRRATGLDWRAVWYPARVLPEVCRTAWARRARGGR
ncbi:MAG: polysaccharide biosynthesis C-terminal domain-containing protein, partial [Actinomycetota bacterium]|nr:polysaccharide biosynthesis C-terminal domain-containing protein [Actinomycetota bacterium]